MLAGASARTRQDHLRVVQVRSGIFPFEALAEHRCAAACEMRAVLDSLSLRLEKQRSHKTLDGREDVAKDQQAHKNARHGEGAAANPVEVAAGTLFTHEQRDDGTAVERRNRQEIEDTQQKIQRKEHKQRDSGESMRAGIRVPAQEPEGVPDAESDS